MKSAAQPLAHPIAVSFRVILAAIGGIAVAITLSAAPAWAWLALKVFLSL